MNFADFHCDTLLKIYSGQVNFSGLNKIGHLDMPRLQAASCVFQCFAAFFDPEYGQEAALRHTLRLLDTARDKIFSLPEVCWIKTAADVDKIYRGQFGGLLAVEGAAFVGKDLFLLELVYNMGVRLITLTWNGRNSLADGVKTGDNSSGLTALGKQAVKIMQDLNIIVDVSHLAARGFWDVAAIAAKPFVASHSNARAVCNHPRNLTDEQIREISRNRGLIGMNLCPPFIAESRPEQSMETLVKHIVHIAEVGGIDVLCLGCDFDGIEELPLDVEDIRDVAKLPRLMAAAGLSPGEIQAVCSDNLLKFLKDNLE